MITACLPSCQGNNFSPGLRSLALSLSLPSSLTSRLTQSQYQSQSQFQSCCCSSGAPSALWGKINIKMEASASILGRIAMQAARRYPRYSDYVAAGGYEVGMVNRAGRGGGPRLTPVSARPKDISNLFTLRGTLSAAPYPLPPYPCSCLTLPCCTPILLHLPLTASFFLSLYCSPFAAMLFALRMTVFV